METVYKGGRRKVVTDERQHEVLLSTINEIQKILDEMFICIDEDDIGELRAGLALISLRSAKLSIEEAKRDVTT